MAGTCRLRRLVEELPVGADHLKTVMFHCNRFPEKQCEQHRKEARASQVDDIRCPEQAQERQQVRLAMECLQRMSHNAALLQRIGYGQISSSNPLLASQAQELIDAGVHVRLYAFMGMALLFFWRLSRMNPLFSRTAELKKLMSSSLVPAYELLRNKAETLTAFKQTHFREALLQGLL